MSYLEHNKLKILEREVKVKERELEHKISEATRSAWRSPLVVAVFAAALGAFGNAGVTYWSSHLNRQAAATKFQRDIDLAEKAAERERILEMIKIGDPEQVERNLQFLIDTDLVKDQETVASIQDYYRDRAPGSGPGATTGEDHMFSAPEDNSAFIGCSPEMQFAPDIRVSSESARNKLKTVAASTGRINLEGHPTLSWVGTGFLLSDDVLITANYATRAFMRDGALDPDLEVSVDFDSQIGCSEPRRAVVSEIVHFDSSLEAGFALLRVSYPEKVELTPIQISDEIPSRGADIALISHPSFDVRRSVVDLERAYGGIVDVKRVAIGTLRDTGNENNPTVRYGILSAGGSGGGPVVDLATGEVFAMHYGGIAGEGGQGVPLTTILQDDSVKALLED